MPNNKLTVAVGANASEFNREMKGVKGVLGDLRKQASGTFGAVGSGMGAMIKNGAGALAGVLSLASAVAVLGKGLRGAIDAEQTKISFEVLTGSAQKAQKVLGDLRKFAAETPFEFPELADAGKKLIAFGFDANEVTDNLRMLGDIASGLGIPIGELAELYGKARVQGRLFAEDVNQLTGRGIPVTQELAKQFGVADGEVRNLVEAGKVGFPELEKAFQSLTGEGGKFFDMMAAQSASLGGQLSTLQDAVNTALTAFSVPIAETLKPDVAEIIKMMDAGGAKASVWGTEAANFAKYISPLIREIPTLIDWAVSAGKGFASVVHLLIWGVSSVFEGTIRMGNTLGNILISSANTFAAILTAGIEKAANAMHNAKDLLTNFGRGQRETDFQKLFAEAKGIFTDMTIGFTDRLKGAADYWGNVAEESAQAIEDMAKKIPTQIELSPETKGILETIIAASGAAGGASGYQSGLLTGGQDKSPKSGTPTGEDAPEKTRAERQDRGSEQADGSIFTNDEVAELERRQRTQRGSTIGTSKEAQRALERGALAQLHRERGNDEEAARYEARARQDRERALQDRVRGDAGAEQHARDLFGRREYGPPTPDKENDLRKMRNWDSSIPSPEDVRNLQDAERNAAGRGNQDRQSQAQTNATILKKVASIDETLKKIVSV